MNKHKEGTKSILCLLFHWIKTENRVNIVQCTWLVPLLIHIYSYTLACTSRKYIYIEIPKQRNIYSMYFVLFFNKGKDICKKNALILYKSCLFYNNCSLREISSKIYCRLQFLKRNRQQLGRTSLYHVKIYVQYCETCGERQIK